MAKTEHPPMPGAERPGYRVKYQSDNRFIAELAKLYGDLPLGQLIDRWKQDKRSTNDQNYKAKKRG